MKKHLSFMSICLALPISVFSQRFVSDSVCYENTISGAKIRCEIPSLAPESDMYFTNLWEIERNGDFIKIVNWYRKPIDETYVNSNGDTMLTVGTGSTTHFNIAYWDQEEVTYVTNKIRQSSQIFQG